MIIVTGSVSLDPAQREAAIALGCEHSGRSRGEDGCLSHNCYVDAEDANRLHFFEQWSDMEAVQKHFAVPESGDFVRQISALATTKPQIRIFNAEGVDGATI